MRNSILAKSLGGWRQISTLVLLLIGIRLWLALPFDQMPTWIVWVGLILGLCFSLSGYLNRAARIAANRVRRFIGKHGIVIPLAVFLAVCCYLYFQIIHDRSAMFLRIHDEHSYRIQSEMLARGKLWMAAYPPDISPFFDTFHVIVDRVYASIYFPGAAMCMVPAVWLGLPYWISPFICGALAAMFFYLIAREMFGSLRALMAVLMLLSLQYFRWMCFMLMSETAFMLAAMILIWAWLRWRRRNKIGWAILMGAAAGWGAITRPLDTVCFVTVVAVAVIFEWRHQPLLIVKTITVAALAAAPFAAIQIIQNVGVTGKWNESPMQYYVNESYPAPLMGFTTADMKKLPPGLNQHKRDFAASWMGLYEEHTLKNVLRTWYAVRFKQVRLDTLPDTDLFILIPLALAARWDIRRVAMLAALALVLIAYMEYIFHFDQYLVPIMPAMLCIVLMGWEALERAWPKYRSRIGAFIACVLIGFTLGAMPEFAGRRWALPTMVEQAKPINQDLAALTSPSVVLFPYLGGNLDWFPVFNDDVAWPDDAKVIRANDLGKEQNWKLYDYYARIQPDRKFYIYGSTTKAELHNLKYLGTARELAASHACR